MFKYVTSYKRESCKSQVSLREIGNSYSYRNSLKFQRSSNLFIRLKGSYFKNQICILRLLSRDSGGRIITISGAHLCTPPPRFASRINLSLCNFLPLCSYPRRSFCQFSPYLIVIIAHLNYSYLSMRFISVEIRILLTCLMYLLYHIGDFEKRVAVLHACLRVNHCFQGEVGPAGPVGPQGNRGPIVSLTFNYLISQLGRTWDQSKKQLSWNCLITVLTRIFPHTKNHIFLLFVALKP